MTTAVTQLNDDFFGLSFEPYNTTPPLALQHMASSIDANNITTGGTITSGGTLVIANGATEVVASGGLLLVQSGGQESVLSGGTFVVSSGGSENIAAGGVVNNAGVFYNSAGTISNSGGTITNASGSIVGGTLVGPITGVGTVSGFYDTFAATDAIATAGSTQATATPLTSQINNVATTTVGQGVNLPQEAAGMLDVVINSGNSGFTVYPVQAGTATINGNAATLGVYQPLGAVALALSTKAGAIEMGGFLVKNYGSIANTASAATTLTASSMTTGSQLSFIQMTGSIGSGQALTLPTVANLLAVWPWGNLSGAAVVRIADSGAGTGSWTLTNNGSFVTAGTSVIAQNTWVDYGISFINGTSAVAQYLGHGTY